MVSELDVRTALVAVIDPEIRRSVVELDMVRAVAIEGSGVEVTIALTVPGCPMKANLERQVREHVGAVEGVESVAVAFDVMSAEQRTALRQRLSGTPAGEERKLLLEPATRVIAVASGKGGVGKSSLTANLAAALALDGAEVGVVDADIYGYSMPRMLGISRRPVAVDQMMIPPVNHGLKIMSIGFFVDGDGAIPWRGPMLHRALEQFLSDVHWGALDYLVVDMPPGTGEISISLQLLRRGHASVRPRRRPGAGRRAGRAAAGPGAAGRAAARDRRRGRPAGGRRARERHRQGRARAGRDRARCAAPAQRRGAHQEAARGHLAAFRSYSRRISSTAGSMRLPSGHIRSSRFSTPA